MACSQITERIYLGNKYASANTKDIDVIVSVGCMVKKRQNGIEYYRFGIRDTSESNLIPMFADITDTIHHHNKLNRRILIHCQGGINRSPIFVLAFLCRYCSMSIEEGMQYIKERRPSARFQPHYMTQLQQWLMNLET